MDEHVRQLAKNHPQITSYVVYEKPTEADYQRSNFDKEGFIDLPWLKQVLPVDANTDIYFCGPVPFMRAMKQALETLEVPEEQIHYEFFGPASLLETETIVP
jgi:nitric oxide dioxygenase